MNYNIMIIALVVALCCYGIYQKYVPTTQRTVLAGKDTFVVGTAAGYAPFVSINAAGDYEGFDIDVAHSLAHQLNKKLVIKDLGSMTALFMALEQGSIDAIIWGLSITQERLQKVAMVRYQGETTTTFPLIFWGAIPSTITSINDMVGKTVCVEPTSAQDSVLRTYPFINIVPTERVDDALLNLQYGKVDAAFVDPTIAQKFKAKFCEINILDVALEPKDHVLGIGIALKNNNTSLIAHVQQAVAELTDTIKEYERIWNIQ